MKVDFENMFDAASYKYIADNAVVQDLDSADLNLILGAEDDAILVNRLNKDMPHVLIAGEAGSGKSIGTDLMLASLLSQHDASELQMILVDYKQYEYRQFKCFRNATVVDSYETSDLIKPFKFLQQEINKRIALLHDHNAETQDAYNKTVGKAEQLPLLLCVVADAAAVVSCFSPEDLAIYNSALQTISLTGSAVGVHLMLTIQKPIKLAKDFTDRALPIAFQLQPDQYARIFMDFKPNLKRSKGAVQTQAGNFIFQSVAIEYEYEDEEFFLNTTAKQMNSQSSDTEILFTFNK